MRLVSGTSVCRNFTPALGWSRTRYFPSLDRACLGFNQQFIDGVDVSESAGLDGVHPCAFAQNLAVIVTHMDGHFPLRVFAAGFGHHLIFHKFAGHAGDLVDGVEDSVHRAIAVCGGRV